MLVRADGKRQAPVVGSHQLPKEALCRGNVTFGTQHKFDGVPGGVDGPVKVLPFFTDFNVRLVEAVRRAAHLQVGTHSPVHLRRVTLDPPEDGDVIYRQPALAHHLFEISVAERVPAVPSDAQKYDGRLEVAPFERGLILLQGYDSRGGLTELKAGL